ncbi:DUF4358 domain-containing protein [Clostridium sp. HCP1S3_B4]|uniref:DUF4358 domain-containing protein n=1 Tax=unclassified Clostridium TaxID=2614128 RepID=UPI0016B966FD|nr:DUF4358 domain-containing protein [Clostridiales bacterium]MDY2728787.1 DUF4358 domain-containing protein [Clostridium sp.]NLK23767.1 DUF4358 domain-containing protein [Clostridiales bacterium]
MNKSLRLLSVAILFFISLNIYSCSNDIQNVDLNEAVKSIMENDSDEIFKDGASKEFKRYYGLNINDYDQVILKLPNSNMDVNEILIVKVKNESDIDLLEESIDARVENQGNIFKDYAPEQYSIVQDYELYIKDNIVFFVISKNAESIKKNFKDILKQH